MTPRLRLARTGLPATQHGGHNALMTPLRLTRSLYSLAITLMAVLLLQPYAAAKDQTLRLATWNLEWLIEPRELRQLAKTCLPRGRSAGSRERWVPCNVADELERSAIDFRTLARYANQLDADVIALQEVDGAAAARRVFRNHDFCFTSRSGVQNNGFAIRKGIPHRCGKDVEELSLGGRVRSGSVLILYPDEAHEIHLLSIHLKAGCPRRPLDDSRSDCATLARQVPILKTWIDTQVAADRRYAILGDFNHDFSTRGPARNDAGELRNFWAEIASVDSARNRLVNVTSDQPFVNCSAGENYSSYIDHVVLGERLARDRVTDSFIRITFDTRDALNRKLSDHCPVGVDIRLTH